MSSLSYFHLLLITLAAAAALLAIFLARRRWNSRPTRLRLLLEGEGTEYSQRLVSLLVFEEEFPNFCEILGLVLERFPLSRFESEPEFQAALEFLDHAACQPAAGERRKAAMCHIVRSFLDDPDVEYRCRPRLSPLVDQFLVEIDEAN